MTKFKSINSESSEFKTGNYQVSLPWYSDMIDLVPSNNQVALKVSNKVLSDLKSKNLVTNYEDAFRKQIDDGILEQLHVSPHDYKDYVWLLHIPILKLEKQVTTMVRPVLHCSLKTSKDSVLLNEAAYPEVDLMSSLLKFIFIFRTNKIRMLADIKAAFHVIKLKDDFHKN